jgi:hypothetical protein
LIELMDNVFIVVEEINVFHSCFVRYTLNLKKMRCLF